MSPPRLIATDLDGTLVHSDGSITPRTQAALLAAEAAGVEVVFVTGRPLRWAKDVFDHVGGHGHAIVSNGALIWDVATSSPYLVRAFESAIAVEVADRIRDAVPGTHYAVETLDGIALETGFLERYPVPEGSLRGSFEEIAGRPVLKILARHEELDPQSFWDAALAVAADLAEITWSSATTLLEISAHQVTKASTLAVFAAERGIGPDEVVAFGDMPNDLPMLEWAGTSYAMANAHPSVRAIATHVAGTNDDDGVAEVIEQLLDS
ncbi:Cof-type HAD-IIB family hydrolase [Nocardioides marmorisolisilvae]|uniref:HAD family phosphatase n=1 Tax=Nocardioides marmorisolisilvae TaxID=1542737 RepID=A0A3N0E0L9_9ACTN|nr:Cof-type HAD-IIB family hydrolase [Nocardioides marmorisolisilvae]RNL81404.1 HAD family phosphatase [Nocardioides marmorisolisilvae]